MDTKLVIFDLDGTLLNTIEDLGKATNFALVANGFPPHALETYPMFVGNGVRKLIERALPADVISDEVVDKVIQDFKSYYDTHNTESTEPYPGIRGLLDGLRERGVQLAVASNKYDKAVKEIIAYYFPEVEFAAVCGQKEGVPPKPDPSVVFSILLETGIPKANTLFVGDSGVDMETAQRACLDSVGVTWGFRSEGELRAKQATFIISTPKSLLDIVDGINLTHYV